MKRMIKKGRNMDYSNTLIPVIADTYKDDEDFNEFVKNRYGEDITLEDSIYNLLEEGLMELKSVDIKDFD